MHRAVGTLLLLSSFIGLTDASVAEEACIGRRVARPSAAR